MLDEEAEANRKERIQQLLRLTMAASGKKDARADLEALNKFLDENDDLWGEVSSISETVTGALLDKLSLDQPAIRELRVRELARIVCDLGYHDAPAVEKLLIKQIVICYLRLWFTEFYYTGFTVAESVNMKVADHWDKRLAHAQKRYTRAIESLARIRKITRSTRARAVEPAVESPPANTAGGALRELNKARRAG